MTADRIAELRAEGRYEGSGPTYDELLDLFAAAEENATLRAEVRNLSEAVDNVRDVLGLESTHWMVIHDEVRQRLADLAAARADKDATIAELREALIRADRRCPCDGCLGCDSDRQVLASTAPEWPVVFEMPSTA